MYYFIVNPMASSGRGAVVWRDVRQYLDRLGVEYKVTMTSARGHATEVAAALTTGDEKRVNKTIVVVGGDGTLNEVVNGISVSAAVTLAYIPAGSGNDFARAMHLSGRPRKAVRMILEAKRIRWLDYGVISYMDEYMHHQRFLISSGMGYDAGICEAVHYSRLKKAFNKVHLGRLAYVGIGLRKLFIRQLCDCELVLDGTRKVALQNMVFLSVHNTPSEGGGFRFAPSADAEDGFLDICAVTGRSRLRVVGILLRTLVGRHVYHKGVHMFRCRECRATVTRPLPVHTDGETGSYLRDFSCVCEQKKLRMIV